MATGEEVGGMDLAFVQEHLEDFNCKLAMDSVDDMLNKLNAMATTHGMDNESLIDALIAFMKNGKKKELSLNVLEDYEQVLSKPIKNVDVKAPSSNLQCDRKVLKELSIADIDLSEHSVADEETEEIGATGIDFEAFDDDKNFSYKSRKNVQRNSLNTSTDRSVKSKYTGTSFVPDAGMGGGRHQQELPTLTMRMISDCKASSYQYGHSNISLDICELFPPSEDDGIGQIDGEYQELPSQLTGSIFPSEGAQLNLDNAMLVSNSFSLPLDFELVDKMSIFPGIRITVDCVHEQGICRVQRVIDPPTLEIARLAHVGELARLKVLIASGPYFISEGNFDQIGQLFHSAHLARANAMILTGPFVPENMELSIDSPLKVFNNFLDELEKQNKQQKMRIFLLPNTQNDLNSMPYFPTPPLARRGRDREVNKDKEALSSSITFAPDPAIFELEGVRFAVSTSEILMHLCRREVYKSANVENEDRMKRLISHLFRSRSLYPLYPADQNLPFSLPNSREKLRLTRKPHVLILPSILQPVTKIVDGCVMINPGRFVRGKNAPGTFSLLDVDLGSALACPPSSSSSATPGPDSTAISIAPFCEVSLLSTTTTSKS